MSVLVVGAGLVGCQVARLEQDAGREPVVFDVAPRAKDLADILDLDRCTVVRGDILNPLDLVAAIRDHGVRRIVHTAAYAGLVAGGRAAPLTATMVNFLGSAHVLEAARLLDVERVVVCSSSTLYVFMSGGEDAGAFGLEEAHPRPTTVYAANKRAVEDLAIAYHEDQGLDVVAARLAVVFGPWAPGGGGGPTQAMAGWLGAAMRGEAVTIDSPGNDWVYSKDAARALHLACWAEGLTSRVFNVGTGVPCGSAEIAEAFRSVFPGLSVQAAPPGGPLAQMAPMDIGRARRQLGFEVEYPLERALVDYRRWMKDRGEKAAG